MAEGKQNLQNAAIIAKLFGVTDRRIQQLAKEGIIPAAQKRPYMFDLLPTVQSYIRYLSDKANGREAKSADTAQVEMEKLRAEADMKRSKADMAAMQLKELEGKMHRSEDVEAVTNDLVYTVRSMIMALPGRCAGGKRQRSLGTDPGGVLQNSERARKLQLRSGGISAAGAGS